MSENEEMKWRLSTETGQEEDKASSSSSSSSEDQQEKEALQERVQAKAEDIAGGRGEASLLTKPEEEEIPITDKQYQSTTKEKRTKKPSKAKVLTKKKESDNANLTGISKQLEKQSNQLVKIEKVLQPLQKSFNKIDRQSITIKQLYSVVIQLQREIDRQKKQQPQQQPTQRRKKERKGKVSGTNI
jgi:hypothetical protein